MVNLHYYINSRKLRVTDEDPAKGKLKLKGHSGTDVCADIGKVGLGPLPTGQYHVYDRGIYAGDQAYVLDPVDDLMLNDRWDQRPDGIHRSAFRIHLAYPSLPNYGSKGCLVLASAKLHQLKSFLDATTKGPVGTVNSPDPSAPGGYVHYPSPLFGVLLVEC